MNKNKNDFHICIIGAGILGASISYQLATRGARVTVLDSGEPGGGASKVSFAWINARDKNPRGYHDLNRRSLDMWDRFARQLGGDVGLTWGGELRWAVTPEGGETIKQRVRTLQSWGYPIQLLDMAALKRIEPSLDVHTVTAASYSTADGHVDTGKVVQACLKKVSEKGGVVSSNTMVTGLHLGQINGGTEVVEAVRVGGDEIRCDAVVLTGGPDIPELAGFAGTEVPLHHTFGATIITEPVAPIFKNAAVVHTAIDHEPQIAFRQFADGSVMVHGGEGGTTSRSLGQTEEEVQQVLQAATKVIPALNGVAIKEVRRGRRPIPDDGHSILGFTQAVPNLYLAATHSGVTLAPLVGEFAAIEIIDGVRIDLLEPYRLERFT